jgi:hypothetical protein
MEINMLLDVIFTYIYIYLHKVILISTTLQHTRLMQKIENFNLSTVLKISQSNRLNLD